MECDSTAILSKLQSADLDGIHRLSAAHLHPFTPLLKPLTKKPAKSSKTKKPPEEDPPPIRRLAKQFLSFIHKALSLLPKRLAESPKIPHDSALELFDVYRLCLDCLDLIAPELAGKPHSVKVQRLRYIHCLEHWEMYGEAEAEGFAVLESVDDVVRGASKGTTRKSKGRYVPVLVEESADREIAVIILELVVTLVKCASKRKTKVGADYWRVISLVNESEPWFRILDAKDYEKFHRFLETNLHITALFLVSEIKSFGVQLVCDFSLLTFKEYKKSHAEDQMYKVALKICSSLFSQRDDISSDIILDVVQHVLDFTAAECKVGVEKANQGFFELVCYCANKCHSATASLCSPVAEHLYRLARASHEDFPFSRSILRLYATGLLASPSTDQSKGKEKENCRNAPLGSSLQALIYNNERLQQLAASVKLLNEYYGIGGKETNSQQEGISLLPYWEALKFLCQALAESMYRDRKEFFSEADSCWDDLNSIHDALHQFCYIFLHLLSATDRERETAGDNHRVISVVVVAALMLSFKTNQNIKESTLLVKHVISAKWVPVKRLKYLYVSLNNIAVILNRKKRLKEAIKALKLCCKASWNYVVDLCKMHADKSHPSHDVLSEEAVADFAREASEKTAFLLELKQEGNCKIDGIIKESLKFWSISENLIATLPIPIALVKEWVKIQYLLSKDGDTYHGTILYSLLSASKEISRKALGKLLEQELLAYDEKSYLDPTYCLRIRLRIINVLLEKVYNTKDNNLKKSEILIEKGKALMAHGSARVDECMQCLSDAISTLKLIYSAKRSCGYRVHHLLIRAYILHALCIHGAVPNSLVLTPGSDFHDDVHAALNLCLSPDHGHVDEKHEDLLYLWYQLIDLLSLKGYLEFHPRLYDVVIKSFIEKNFSMAKTVAELWRNRRLSHALCASPVNHMFVDTFSNHQSQICNSADFWRMCMEELKPLVVGFHQINNEIKQAASNLISQVPQTSWSIFLSSNLYFDLCGRLISSGCMIEALAYAKEAHRLRSKLLQQKFEYSVEKMTETFSENGSIIEKNYYGIQTFKVNDFAVTKGSRDTENCILTPWNVLSCYLESVLQVGLVHEILGNVSEAEMLLRWGRNVSRFQGLPLFEISFSSMLGKLYHKQKHWNIAEKELSSAKKILADNLDVISCKRCSCMLEISINQQMGDLFLGSSCSTGESPSTKKLINAKSLYKSVLEKINYSDWSASYTTSEEARIEQFTSRESSLSSVTNILEINNDTLSNGISETKIVPRRSRRTKKEQPASQRQDIVHALNRRRTRSTHRSTGEPHEILPNDTGPASGVSAEHMYAAALRSNCNVPDSQYECYAADFQSDVTSLCNKMKCWRCLHTEAVDYSSLNTFIYLNWELVYRKLCLRLLISIGKFYGICGNVHDAHEILLQSISVLFSRYPYCTEHSSDSLVFLIESIGKVFPGDALTAERAALLYYICWFSLKSYAYPDKRNGNICSELSCIGTIRIVSLLKQAFILCREVPLLFQKISRLLAAVYVLSTSLKQFSLSPNKKVSECQWASFFHQSSLGTHLNQQILSGILQSKQNETPGESEDSSPPNSVSTILDLPGSLRPAPESCEDLEKFIIRFFQGLPSTPIICISFVTDVDASLLGELLHCSPTVRAFILLSHLSADNQHVILLPVYETLEASYDDASSSSVVFNCKDVVKQWQCPWVSSVIDDIAPAFRHVLEGNYYSSSEYFLECINENTSLWWMHRKRLDECLGKFLQDVEDLWLGTWKYLLLGEWPDCTLLDSIEKDLSEDDRHLLQLVVTKKCYIGQRLEATPKSSNEFENMMQLLFKRMVEVSDNFDQVEYMNRKPIILVLDSEVQMLPWENLPILRNQEVYRMPSVGTIFATLGRCCQNQERFQTNILALPSIDPLDSYYLLNPDGDLNRTQVEFENWFKDKQIEGKIGTVPTIEELTLALKNHDLFIYFGHGSGMQYIPGHEIQKLDGCAASLLLGCSSGSLYLKGSYMPQGAPIYYLLAGSPVIVANLWEVTDKDIDRFGKAMLNAWLRERLVVSSECNHRRRIGSFMGQAREACTLGFLIGAAPVCYGVPTGIIKRKNV